ncbi:MAG: DegV family protein [Firmicutes bacterium]|nr:DegV family protein [Bacillota bacterium]
MPQKIKLITDSAADLPEEIAQNYDIDIVPLRIFFDDKEYLDKVTLSTPEFYKLLAASENLPSTTQITPVEFSERFEKYLKEGYKVLYIGISSKLSGTLQSAVLAKELLGSDDIEVFDSLSASIGIGLLVIRAAEMAAEGKSLHEIISKLTAYREQAFGYLYLDTLNNLVKGGRLSKAKGVVGSLLRIKPVLKITEDGEIVVAEKTRSLQAALSTIVKRAKERQRNLSNESIAIAHTNAPELAEKLSELVQEEFKPRKIVISLAGPTVGTHVGPGGVGLFF